MNEKKLFEMNDDALQNVTGGQGGMVPAQIEDMAIPDLSEKFEDPNVVYLCCPECGGSLNVITYKNDNYPSTLTTVCPHCNKTVSVTV